MGDDDSPDLDPQFSKVQSLDETPVPAHVQETETPCDVQGNVKQVQIVHARDVRT